MTSKRLIYANAHTVTHPTGSFRHYYSTVYGTWPFPVDRFNVLPSIDADTLSTVNIIKDPNYNLLNLSVDWQDRYWAICDQVGTNIYATADVGYKTIVVMYSGGIDSAAALVSLMKNTRYREFLDQGRLKVALSSSSIAEYPEYFYNRILPEIPVVPVDYNTAMLDPTVLVVTGDAGDYVIGNTDTPIFYHNGATNNLYEDKSVLYPYLDTVDTTGKFSNFARELCKHAPFDIVSVNQLYWWIGQCFVHQGEMCYPFNWSATTDMSELATNNKVYRFFLDDLFTTFSFEYMSTNPRYTTYNSVRDFPRKYIVDYTRDQTYLTKIKLFSQSFMFKQICKSAVYEDLTFSTDFSRTTQ